MKGHLLYAANLNDEVYSIDPEKGEAAKTRARGQLLAVDAADGKYVYAGIQKPIRDQLVFQRVGEKVVVSLAQAGRRALLAKYEVSEADLKPVAANDNAAINGRGLGLSPDGKRVAMAGGGWQSKTDRRANYAIAIFDTADLTTQLGQVDTGPYPVQVSFHSLLNLGVAFADAEQGLIVFNGKSFAKREAFRTQDRGYPVTVLFAGRGTKVVFAATGQGTGAPANSALQFFPLKLSDAEKETLQKATPQ